MPRHLRMTNSAMLSAIAKASRPGHSSIVVETERPPASKIFEALGENRPPVNAETCFNSVSFEPYCVSSSSGR
jgi:hypothetical protein